ncbi:MAG: hypothetical protein H7838_09500 [Magnetococcus sp. DMHC-8]
MPTVRTSRTLLRLFGISNAFLYYNDMTQYVATGAEMGNPIPFVFDWHTHGIAKQSQRHPRARPCPDRLLPTPHPSRCASRPHQHHLRP